jgi:hypothetical protein
MDLLPQALGRRYGTTVTPGADRREPLVTTHVDEAAVIAPSPAGGSTAVPGLEFEAPIRERRQPPTNTTPGLLHELRLPVLVYLATRVLYLLIVLADQIAHGGSLTTEVTNWDGVWYDALAHYGYPSIASHAQTTLGFLPLFSVLMLGLSHISPLSNADSGLLISTLGGLAATVLVRQLARLWWDEAASRRVVVFFCLFPGSIVFSMVYSEGILIPLVAGCLLALEYRRWFLAGVLAAAATAVAPVAVAIVPACAVGAGRALYLSGRFDFDPHRVVLMPMLRGLRDRQARRALWAPVLAPTGLIAFGLYLWYWTGTPLASYNAQRYGWGEKTTVFAVSDDVGHMFHELFNFGAVGYPNGINLNYDSGVIGAAFLLTALWLILRGRRWRGRMPAAAIIWTLWCAVETLTSFNTPPNPRMLICAFPALMVVAARLRGNAYRWLIGCSTLLLIVMSFLTYHGNTLRP